MTAEEMLAEAETITISNSKLLLIEITLLLFNYIFSNNNNNNKRRRRRKVNIDRQEVLDSVLETCKSHGQALKPVFSLNSMENDSILKSYFFQLNLNLPIKPPSKSTK